jgi:hypothetical protein
MIQSFNITIIQKDKLFQLTNINNIQYGMYRSLSDIYGLFTVLSNDGNDDILFIVCIYIHVCFFVFDRIIKNLFFFIKLE